MLELILFFALPFLAAGGVQLAILRWTRGRWRLLGWLPPLAALPVFRYAWETYHSASMFGGFSQLAAFAWGCMGGCILLGWAAAFGLWKVGQRRKTRREQSGTQEE